MNITIFKNIVLKLFLLNKKIIIIIEVKINKIKIKIFNSLN